MKFETFLFLSFSFWPLLFGLIAWFHYIPALKARRKIDKIVHSMVRDGSIKSAKSAAQILNDYLEMDFNDFKEFLVKPELKGKKRRQLMEHILESDDNALSFVKNYFILCEARSAQIMKAAEDFNNQIAKT